MVLKGTKGFFAGIALAAVFLGSRSGQCWTSAGPWGGAVHDLVNAPAGGTTLLAATANGLYLYEGSLPWVQYPGTAGLRVLQVAPDPGREVVYLIALLGQEPYSAIASTPIFPGTLYRMDLSGGSLSAMMATEVSSVTVCGDGTVLAARNARGTAGTGYVYRFPSGYPHTQTVIQPFYPYWPIFDILGSAGSSTIFAIRNATTLADALISQNNAACGATWLRSRIAGVASPTFTKSIHLNGGFLSALGRGGAGTPLLGSSAGSVYAWAGTNWQSGGVVSPAFPVAGFGTDAAGSTLAILRKYNWDEDNGDDEHGGLFAWTGSAWARDARFDHVTSRVAAVVSYPGPTGWETWAAFDEAGVRRIPNGGSAPGLDSDEGITAADLTGILIDPREDDRAMAFGTGGLYERRDGEWRHLVLATLQDALGNPLEEDNAQVTRERGFMAAAFSADDPGVFWAGGDTTGLFRAQRTAPDSWDYTLKRVYWETLGGGSITEIVADPFDQDSLWIATKGRGVLRSRNDGLSWTVITSPLPILALKHDLLEPAYRTFLAGIQPPGNGTGLLSGDGNGYFSYTSLFLYGSWVESLAFHPLDDSQGQKRALAGPSLLFGGQGMAVLRDGTGDWQYNPDTVNPVGLPPSAHFDALAVPLGADGDGAPDAFTAVHTEGANPVHGLFYSVADTLEGSPGRDWHDMDPYGEIAPFRPTSVTVHPRDGNLLWVTTRTGSAFTLMGSHVTDTVPPAFPLSYGLVVTGARAGDGIDLFWLAPGDDGDLAGWADRYRLYYRTDTPITGPGDLAGAYSVDLPRPHIAHREEAHTLDISAHAGSEYFSIALRAFDEQGNASAIETAAVNFSWGNQPPVAENDSQATLEDYPVTIPVLDNDDDPDPDPLSILRVTAPSHGSVTVNPDQTLNYVPTANFYGTDSFTYTIIDGRGGSDTAAVSLTVTAVNDPPVASDDAALTTEDPVIGYLSVFVLANDSDPDTGSTLSCSIVSPPAHAQYCSFDNSERTILTYVPVPNFSGTDSLTYRLTDGAGASDTAVVTITLTPVNDLPVAADDAASTDEDIPVGVAATANDSDVDGDALYVGAISSPPAHGTAATVSAGTISYAPEPDWSGTDGFTYTVRDGKGGQDIALVTVTVRPVNDPPLVTGEDLFAFSDTPAVLSVLGNDTDVEGGPLVLAYVGAPGHGTAAILDGNAGTVLYTPAPGYVGTDSFPYTVSDPGGATGQGTVNLTVILDEDRPVAVDDPVSTPEDTVRTIWALQNDLDASTPSLAISALGTPSHGTADISADAKCLTYTPQADYHGADTFSYTVMNGLGGTDCALVTVSVTAVNDPPVAQDDTATAVAGPVFVGVLANDDDPADGDTVYLQTVIVPPAHGSAASQPDGTILYTPVNGFAGTDAYIYRVTDYKGGSQTDDASVTVSVLNTPVNPSDPVAAWDPLQGAVSQVRVAFDSGVTAAGKTFCETGSGGPAAPSGYRAGTPARYHLVSTTALHGAPVTVSINYAGVSFANDQNLAMFRHDGSAWQPLTGQAYPSSDYMDAETGELGLFALFETVSSGGGGGGGGGGGCFIATAAFGSALAPEVDRLRAYRDGYLVHRAWGRALVDAYHRFSPPAARVIAGQPVLRAAARMALRPIIHLAGEGNGPSVLPAALGLCMAFAPVGLVGVVVLAIRRRRHRRIVRGYGKTRKLGVN